MLIAAGPTREPLDAVRFLSNYSTGYMGARLADEALARGHRVTVICGPVSEPMPSRARVIPVERAHEMERALRREAKQADVVIMAAAVADFQSAHRSRGKWSRRGQLTLRLKATPDLIGRLPRRIGQTVVGFALETGRVLERARAKLRAKRLDMVLAQRMNGHSSPFGKRAVRAWLLTRNGSVAPLGLRSKPAVARSLFDAIEALHARAGSCC